MVGYVTGDTPQGEMTAVQEAFARATAAIYAWPDPRQAWESANALSELMRDLQSQAGDFRGHLAVYLQETHGLSLAEIATFFGLSPSRTSRILAAAKKRGNPVVEPTSLPEQPPIVLAIITSDRGVLIAKRADGIPPWTFPGGEIDRGESSGDAAKRRVLGETGVEVTATTFIGRRIHPKTSRVMVYVHAAVNSTDVTLSDPEDLTEVRWAGIDETRELMPDMYGPVRQYLDEVQHALAQG
jgi:8-oxo-dGTP diphosphatase